MLIQKDPATTVHPLSATEPNHAETKPAPPAPPSRRIEFRKETGTFFLHSGPRSGGSTYAFKILRYGCLAHLYWGAALVAQTFGEFPEPRGRAFSPNPERGDFSFSLDTTPLEYPVYGSSDFRSPALEITHRPSGGRVLNLRYAAHRILAGKPPLDGLPSTYTDSPSEAETLIVELRDEAVGIKVELLYTAFADHPVLTRSARVTNTSGEPVILRRALSCSLDFPARFSHFHWTHLHGAWAREAQVASNPLHPGTQSIESRRGASSHAHNPFFALCELDTHEEYGAVYGFNLVYSGNFWGAVELDPYGSPRAQLGLNPFDFSWELGPNDAFQTPEAVLVFSNEGLGGMSRSFHRFYRRHLISAPWRDKTRPVLINNWEATYYDFDEKKIEAIAEVAAQLGVELFVIDDGWFGRRNDTTSSLGDWIAHKERFPCGLAETARRINRHGLAFGLWFEPEMVSPDSDLYRAHPDWCLHVPTHPRSEGRDQLILDLSRPEVCEAIYENIAKVLRSAPVSYVKWDMNRNMTEIGSAGRTADRQPETAHRYMLGLYGLMARFRNTFPEILFEGCSGGGGRFDPGILHYMPQIWTSDNSDAIARLRIQYGTSLVYPLSASSAHISTVPNHQVGRVTSLSARGHVAFTGAFGLELDAVALNSEGRAEITRQIALYKRLRGLLVSGDLYRLRSPFKGNEAAWMVVSPDRGEALVTHVTVLAEGNPPAVRLPLRGLEPGRFYRIDGEADPCRGDFLMRVGLRVPEATGDFVSHQWHLRWEKLAP